MEKKTLLLITPKNSVFKGWSLSPEFIFQPLNLGIIAALTPSYWKIKIIDENMRQFKYYPADLVGITSFTSTSSRAYEIASLYRSKNTPVVMGGIHATLVSNEALNYVDTVVKGEAESVWPSLISDFEAGRLQRIYEGKIDESPILISPKPRRDLFHPGYTTASVQTTRGCPMDCHFCSVTAFNGKHYRHRPIEDVLDELEEIPQHHIFFVDDNIIGYSPKSIERAKELFEGMIRRGFKKSWGSQASLNFGDDDELLELARRSGCANILIGIETESEDQLKEVQKNFNIRKGVKNFNKIVQRIHKHGIFVIGAFIFGFEKDDAAALRRRRKYINHSAVDIVQATILTPLPGTKTFGRMEQLKMIDEHTSTNSWSYFTFYNLVFKHPHFEKDEFYKEMLKVFQSIYHPWNLFRRSCRTFLSLRKMETKRKLETSFLTNRGNHHYWVIVKDAMKLWNKKQD
ncbi:MAG: radical SAM protein [Bacteroidota bacterium]|nr:radical SAM protein [Bacteroidota bacterium]